MRIKALTVENYRNLKNVTFTFDLQTNIIVGRNNTGKSNLLDLINSICHRRPFDATDFNEVNQPVNILLKLRIENLEIGIFDDLFDEEHPDIIDVCIVQEAPSEPLKMSELKSGLSIPIDTLRFLNVVHYSSDKNFGFELNIAANRGPSRILRRILERYIGENELSTDDLINEKGFSNLVNHMNSMLTRIRPFKDNDILATSQPKLLDISARTVILQEHNGYPVESSGTGIQYLMRIPFSILGKIDSVMSSKYQKSIFEDSKTKKKVFPFVFCLDEPEIHLHPFMQRSLINYIRNIVSGNDPDFNSLVKDIYDIDTLSGQLFVVTHSPFIIGEDYREILKLYIKEDKVSCISGISLDLGDKYEKHLKLRYPFIKEAFFSRAIIAVEGESEEGSLKLWGTKLGFDFDSLEIGVIRCQGESVPQILTILQKFGVYACGILDRDDGRSEDTKINLFVTQKRDFEEELVDAIISNKKSKVLKDIVKSFDPMREKCIVQKTALHAHLPKYGIDPECYQNNLSLAKLSNSNPLEQKAFFISWLETKKSLDLGYLIGEMVPKEIIPTVYLNLISLAAQ